MARTGTEQTEHAAAWAADYLACLAGEHGPAWRTRAEREHRRDLDVTDPTFVDAWAQVRTFLAA